MQKNNAGHKHQKRMTENQYKTLRRLILLWFTVVVRRKYSILLNLFTLLSVAFNIFILVMFLSGDQKVSIIEKTIDFNYALDMRNYNSISNSKQTMQQRYNFVYNTYVEDKAMPDSYYYNNKDIKREWVSHCKGQLRKILSIKTRIRDIEILLEKTYPNHIERIQEVVQTKRQEETLSDMSNYYARFISAEEYKYLTKAMD